MTDATTQGEDLDWQAAWKPLIAKIGVDLAPDEAPRYGADTVEAGTIRRYLEPLEFDCALHYDPEVARAHGHPDVTAPYTSLTTFSLQAVWAPGEVQFTSAERNAQPERRSVGPRLPAEAPPTTGFFVTDWEAEYLRPATVGDRLARRGYKLVECVPKETRVGRGAFCTFESEIIDAKGETVARLRSRLFIYNPHPKKAAA